MTWTDHAACKNHPDPDLWFAEESERPAEASRETFRREQDMRTQQAKKVCHGCPVRLDCLEAALDTDVPPMGMWGATTFAERRNYRKRRNRARRTAKHA